jgi:short-subunit dehydrogenase
LKQISIITGGSSGLGFALANGLVLNGDSVAIIGRNNEKLKKAKKILSDKVKNTVVLSFAGDITDELFIQNTFNNIIEDGWIITKLFNCAGIGRFGNPEENTREMLDITLGASVIGTVLMSTQALKAMKENGGTIINIISTAALKGRPNETVYCASKWGVKGYTEALRTYLENTNIKVVGVYPGGMNTPFWGFECGETPDSSKLMNPSEVAEVILHSVQTKETMYVSDIIINKI